MTNTGTWVYAVVGDGPIDADLPPGVAGERVRVIEAAGLTAVVGSVPFDTFGDEALHRNLEKADWLDDVARVHDGVVGAVAHTADTVPMRLATVYSDDDDVRATLSARRTAFDTALRRIAGRAEWGVRGVADTSLPRDNDDEPSSRADIELSVAADANEVYAALLEAAVAGRRREPAAPELAGSRPWMPLVSTYLVERRRTGDFAAAVSFLNRTYARLELELTGPWPPYSFTGIDEDPGPS
ncbi:GvpL/GvpF family gas vesicle protein [Rhodococcus sp. Eu-32]|uniref:GvpL/GvpF family gas vesicle protein n=1 Tax=Rhodococcus sp. Eu-32 TaxID=1017319 RepID=UPI001402FB62|nr:GvpL/GvpF family gas vesicle protein [Rhodococcus sp. Eu-32]